MPEETRLQGVDSKQAFEDAIDVLSDEIRDLFNPEATIGKSGVIRADLNHRGWQTSRYYVVRDGVVSVSTAAPVTGDAPRATIRATLGDYLSWAEGRISWIDLVLSGRAEIEDDEQLLQRARFEGWFTLGETREVVRKVSAKVMHA